MEWPVKARNAKFLRNLRQVKGASDAIVVISAKARGNTKF